MEYFPSLRSLEAVGRPSGTGRPTSSLPSEPEPEGQGFEDRLVQARTARETPPAREPAPDVDGEPLVPTDAPSEPSAGEPAPEVEPQAADGIDRGTDAAPTPEPDSIAPDDAQADLAATVSPAVPPVALPATSEVPGVARTTETPPDGQRAIPRATLPLPATVTKATAAVTTGAEPVLLEPLTLAEAQADGTGGEGPGGDNPQSSATSAHAKSETAAAIGSAAAREPEFAEQLARSVAARENQRAPTAADSERAADVLRQVRVAITPELRSATIALSPPSLGRIHVRMSVRAGELTAVIRAEEPAALQALAHQLPELRATLAQQGLAVQHFDLGLGFDARRDAHREHPTHDGSRPADRDERPAASAAPRELHSALARASAGSGIDTYA